MELSDYRQIHALFEAGLGKTREAARRSKRRLTSGYEGDGGFLEDLISDQGAKDHGRHQAHSLIYRFMSSSMGVCGAAIDLIDYEAEALAVFRRTKRFSAKSAERARFLTWHYQYVLRERTRIWLRALRECGVFSSDDVRIKGEIAEVERAYKKQTDKIVSARGRHTHEKPHFDPFLKQLELLELLTHERMDQRKKDRDFILWSNIKRSQMGGIRQSLRESTLAGNGQILKATDEVVGRLDPYWKGYFDAFTYDYD